MNKNIILKCALLITFLLQMLYSENAFAQDKAVKIYVRPYKDSIALRWQVYDPVVWKQHITLGYDVYRKSSNGTIVKLNEKPVKAFNDEEFVARYLVLPPAIKDTNKINELNEHLYHPKEDDFKYNPDSAAVRAYILQNSEDAIDFGELSEDAHLDFGNDPNAIRWLFHSITCLASIEASIVSGLYFLDKKVDRHERYEYILTSAGKSVEEALAKVSVSSVDNYPMIKPVDLKDVTLKMKASFTWKKADTSLVFLPTYEIVRSETKNGKYVRMNTEPILSVYTGEGIDTTIVTYVDNTLEKGKIYFYKVRGLDLFGEYTPYSEPLKVTDKATLESVPFIIEARKEGDPPVSKVKWAVLPEEEENISYFNLYRSDKPDTLFVPLSGNLKKDKKEYIDKNPKTNNYYKVMAVGYAGDTVWSSPIYVLIPDSIPPAAPVVLKATCDSLGIVTITWKHNNEPDLNSFKIFRANYKHEEFSRIAEITRVDTIYRDTITLAALDEAVYYKILAYDDSYNPSDFSNIIKAKRYDTIPPNHPVFYEIRTDSSGIFLSWGNSSSMDVVKTILYRKFKDESDWHEYKVFAKDTMRYGSFTDNNIEKGYWYEYALAAIDDDGLNSGMCPKVQLKALDDGFRPEIQKINQKSNARKRIVKLSWEYSHFGVELFQVYRAVNDDKIAIYSAVGSGSLEFYDREVGSGEKYTYRVKAVFNDGGESPLSKEIVVQF